jgi:hypothetical protein
MNATTASQLRELASGNSYAAFKSAALAVGLAEDEVEAVWHVCNDEDVEVESDARESGMELQSDRGWLTSTTSVELEDWR